ncbi:hypothetical protein [Meridianimarinicoccus aquatilis]|uniref:VPLPA-CTERM sorting domain-containing protein n=1 Tax=Meridianimarinicoccus aquatilis TaxID=2552766 RepID=A0A4R6B194_9RHOB|nr:hypothetical protein [Fluviibacterium aquatile]TDL88978.1 hypothetical protein E2L05_08415 [Fluviibacterium aquatile]
MRKFPPLSNLLGAACLALLPAWGHASALAPFDSAVESLLGFTTFTFEFTEQDATSQVAVSLVEEIDLYQTALRFSDTDLPPAPLMQDAPQLSSGSIGLAMAGFVGNLTNLSTYDSVRVVFSFDLLMPIQAITSGLSNPALGAGNDTGLSRTFDRVKARGYPGRNNQAGHFIASPSFPRFTTTSADGTVTLAPGEKITVVIADLFQPMPNAPQLFTPPQTTAERPSPVASTPPAPSAVPLPATLWSLLLGLAVLCRKRPG